jgi:multidrug efflux pump subunit AcrA (membrane-fusion protein)
MLIEMKRRFGRFVQGASWIIGFAFFVLASLVGTFLIQKNLGILYLLFALFFLCRSRVAFYQIRAFCEHRYGVLLFSGAAIIGAVLFAQHMISGMSERLGFYAFTLLSTLLILIPVTMFRIARISRERMLSPPEWIARLREVDAPVRIRAISVATESEDYQVLRIAARLLSGTAHHSAVCRMGRSRIVWFEDPAQNLSPTLQQLFQWGSGLLKSVRETPELDSGQTALLAAQRAGLLGEIASDIALATGREFDLEEIRAAFRQRFPQGFCFNTRTHRSEGPRRLVSGERRQVFFSAMRHARSPFQRIESRHFDVTALLVSNEIRVIFAIPADVNAKSRKLWRSFANEFNVMCASGAKVNDGGTVSMILMQLRKLLAWTVVSMAAIAAGMVPMEDRIVGTFVMKPTHRAEVRAPFASFLTAVNAGEGEMVTAGNLISEMQVPGLESDISQVQSEIAESRARLRILGAAEDSDASRSGKLQEYRVELEYALKTYKKARSLLERGAFDELRFRQHEKEYKVRASRYQQLLAEQDAERAHLTRSLEKMRYLESVAASLQLEAPIDGTIVTRDLPENVGRYFEEGDIVFEVVDPSKLEAELSIPEQDMIYLQAGQQVELKVFALPYQTISTRVTRVAPMVGTGAQDREKFEMENSNGIKVYSNLDQVIPELIPGMTGYARITLREQFAAIVLAKRLMRFVRTEFWW